MIGSQAARNGRPAAVAGYAPGLMSAGKETQMNGLGARTKKARAAVLFSKVLSSDKQGRIVKVLLPGSDQ